MIKKLLFLIAVPACLLKAQNAPIKITIFSHDSATVSQTPEKPGNYGTFSKNLIKWNYCLLTRGVFLLNYERHLSKNFTLEVGGGITYSDFIFSSYYEIANLGKSPVMISNPITGNSTTTTIMSPFDDNSAKKLGFALEVSPRFYFEKDEFKGIYLSPYMSFRKYNYSLTEEETNSTTYYNNSRTFDDLYYTFFDVGGKIGYQYYFYNNDAFYYDVYFGIAYRTAHVNTLLQTDAQGYNGNTTTFSEYTQTMGLFNIMLGGKIGYAF